MNYLQSLLKLKDRVFYGWVIVATALVVFCIHSGIRFSFGVFLKSLQGDFDLSRAAISSVFSIHMILSIIFSIVSGWAVDRYGPRLVVSVMGFFVGLSLLITSQATSFWQLFISYSLLLAIGTAGNIPVLIPTISRWFEKKRGIAIGIATSGIGLGSLVMSPFAAYLITDFGWRVSYVIMGLIAWVVVISMATLFRRGPADIGLLPDGGNPGDGIKLPDRDEDNRITGASVTQALKTRNFWLMLSIWLLFGICLSLILTHVVPYATDRGISIIQAATIVSVMSAFNILAGPSVGRISDIIGRMTGIFRMSD